MPRKRLSPAAYIAGVQQGDRVVLSQAITLMESQLTSDQALAQQVMEGLMPFTGNSFRIGITGVPGVGKSTFIDAFGTLLTGMGKRVAVLAIDPSSSRGRGSILGDKTRMHRLSQDPEAYVRPSPSSGSLGGVARKTREAMLVCEAAGYDIILVETVGVGQSEVAVKGMVDAFVLLMLPHAGDDLQGIKKGVMEMADLMVINKADGDYLPKARAAVSLYGQALRLFPHTPSGWQPPVRTASALEGVGLMDVWETLIAFQQKQQSGAWWQENRATQANQWMEDEIQRQLHMLFEQDPRIQALLPQMRAAVQAQQQSPIQAAIQLVATFRQD